MVGKMRSTVLLAVLLLLLLATALPASQARADDLAILKFGTMVGVPSTFAGVPIRGVNGAGLSWFINGADGKLTTSGKLDIVITGLVFNPNDPTVISRGLANRNTVATFGAVVSCLTINNEVMNIATGRFPATIGLASEGGGDAHIQARLELPSPCIAPIVFITSPGGSWFAVTGH